MRSRCRSIPLGHHARAFDIDVRACPSCYGRLRLITTIDDPAIIQEILAHLASSESGLPHLSPVPPRPDRVEALASMPDRKHHQRLVDLVHIAALDASAVPR